MSVRVESRSSRFTYKYLGLLEYEGESAYNCFHIRNFSHGQIILSIKLAGLVSSSDYYHFLGIWGLQLTLPT